MTKRKRRKFKLGDTVVFEPKNFNKKWWDAQKKEDLLRYYGSLGYNAPKLHLFMFVAEHSQQPGHCTLISLADQHVETMRHTSDFRLATEDEV